MSPIEEIRKDRVHGARWLTQRAANILLTLAREGYPDLRQACRELAAAQPAMAPLVQLANAAARAGTPAEVETLCVRTLFALERSGRAVAERAAVLIGDGAIVLTHSYSGTVEAALLQAHTRRTRFRVIATESQPLGEGAQLADSLRRSGIPVTLIPDDAVPVHLPKSSLVMV
ncbi:MAG TPA: hypothetical protein VFL57_02435, partial [Bryobacteraceae bacterium]|nr:hypothetical protein [Bryobacteraceae bacterium]